MLYPPLILIAEDLQLNMMLIVSMVNKLIPEAEVIEVTNGKKAVEIVERIKTDLIFMDIQMPEMDGFEATRQIRKLEAIHGVKQPVPIIAVTAFVYNQEKQKCLQVGMNDFLSKPINKDSINGILKRYLDTFKPQINGHAAVGHSSIQNNHFDIKALAERTAIEEPVLMELAKEAAASLSNHMRSLSEAIYNDNMIEIKFAAHTIKGIALNISFNKLAQMIQKLEALAQEDTGQIETSFANIKEEVGAIQSILC